MPKRRCQNCGEDISKRPIHHYLCYDCWLNTTHEDVNESNDNYLYISSPRSHYNSTYEERYKGDSDYDMGPYWDYDEYPPENL